MKQIIESSCTQCGEKLDAYVHPSELEGVLSNRRKAPRDGDFTICISCANIMCYNEDLTLRALCEEDVLKIQEDEDLYAQISRFVNEVLDNK